MKKESSYDDADPFSLPPRHIHRDNNERSRRSMMNFERSPTTTRTMKKINEPHETEKKKTADDPACIITTSSPTQKFNTVFSLTVTPSSCSSSDKIKITTPLSILLLVVLVFY
jgi:hypothetical protein